MRDDKNKLFVGNLSYSVTKEQLEELFSSVEGVEVVEATIVTDRETDRPRGFGFVVLANEEMLAKAIEALNNQEVDGRRIIVNVAKPREDRGGNRGGYQQNNFRSGGRRY